MRGLIFLLPLLLLLVPISTACIYEYRDVVFYPSGDEKVGRDWIVVNFTNPYPFQLYDVDLKYRGAEVYLPNIPSGETLKIDPYTTLSPKKFPLRVFAKITGERITYTIRNEYNRSLLVNISIPVFRGFTGCAGCSVKKSINFSSEIPAGGNSSFTLYVNTTAVEIPDGKIEFRIEKSVPVSYGVDVKISVEKERRGNEWYATFYISNLLNRDVDVNFKAWYTINSQQHELFNQTLHLGAMENVSFSAPPVTSSTAPVFYIKARARISDLCNVAVIPATKKGNSYVIGYAVLRGLKQGGGGGAGEVGGRGAEEVVVPPPQQQPQQPPSQSQGPVSVPFSINFPQLSIPEITTASVVNYVAMMLPAAYGLFFATVLFPLMTRRGVVVTQDMITPRNYALLRAYGRKLYTTPSGAFPGCIVVEPDEALVERFMNLGLQRRDAECIAAAIKIKKPMITSNRKVAEVASKNGCVAILIGREWEYGRA